MDAPKYPSAVIAQYVLIGIIVLVTTGICFVFIGASNLLTAKATDTDHARIDAEIAEGNVNRLKQLQSKLNSEQNIIQKTEKIVADSQSYAYQGQVIEELTAYAKETNVSIIGIDFGAKPGEKPAAGKTKESSLKRTLVSIQLGNDTPYGSLYAFIQSIEQNVTKMQLTGINFQPKKDEPNIIIGSTLEIVVYLR